MKYFKKTFFIVSFSLICFLNKAYTIDNYQVGDSLYIWAKNGLKLWEEPNIKSELIESIPFGWRIIVNEKTSEKFNVKVNAEISKDYTSDSTQPFILKGNWVKVKCLKSGKIGYLIDQYLLKAKPILKNPNYQSLLIDEEYKLDTIYYNTTIPNNEGAYLKVRKEYKEGITVTGTMTEKGNFTTIQLKNYSIEEAYVLTGDYWIDSNLAKLIKNWKEKLIIYDGGMCEYYYSLKGNIVTLEIICSC